MRLKGYKTKKTLNYHTPLKKLPLLDKKKFDLLNFLVFSVTLHVVVSEYSVQEHLLQEVDPISPVV